LEVIPAQAGIQSFTKTLLHQTPCTARHNKKLRRRYFTLFREIPAAQFGLL
jgi:hypothetical protein